MQEDSNQKDVARNPGLEKVLGAGAALRKPFLERLETLFAVMDQKYRQVSDQYGFHCQGCKDNCCRTTFHHHTVLEFLYLLEGFERIGMDQRAAVLKQAARISLQPSSGHLCPLCRGGRCLLYAYRPMICRLHGIAHEVHRPDRAVSYGPGCAAFEAAAKGKGYIVFDRTEFYWELSRLEQEARAALGVTQRIKMTVSQMVTAFLEQDLPARSHPNEKR